MEAGAVVGFLVLVAGLVWFANRKADQKRKNHRYDGEVGEFPNPDDR